MENPPSKTPEISQPEEPTLEDLIKLKYPTWVTGLTKNIFPANNNLRIFIYEEEVVIKPQEKSEKNIENLEQETVPTQPEPEKEAQNTPETIPDTLNDENTTEETKNTPGQAPENSTPKSHENTPPTPPPAIETLTHNFVLTLDAATLEEVARTELTTPFLTKQNTSANLFGYFMGTAYSQDQSTILVYTDMDFVEYNF